MSPGSALATEANPSSTIRVAAATAAKAVRGMSLTVVASTSPARGCGKIPRSGDASGRRPTAGFSRRVERLVDQAVGERVVLAADGRVANRSDAPGNSRGLQRELHESRVLDAVVTAHLLDQQLGVGDHLEIGDSGLGRGRQPRNQGAVLGDVVRRDPDRLAARIDDRAVLRLEDVGRRCRPRVPACAAIGVEAGLHGSSSGYTSNAGSS